jgi:hypothetical protein
VYHLDASKSLTDIDNLGTGRAQATCSAAHGFPAYKTKTITISQANGIATCTCASHGFSVGETVLISGASDAGYNTLWMIESVPSSSTFTFSVPSNLAASPTGTITAVLNYQAFISGASNSAYNGYKKLCQTVNGSTTQFTFEITGSPTNNDTGTVKKVNNAVAVAPPYGLGVYQAHFLGQVMTEKDGSGALMYDWDDDGYDDRHDVWLEHWFLDPIQFATITRSGTTATVACTAHGLVTNDKVMVYNAVEAYNGLKTVTGYTTNTFTFTCAGTEGTPATGPIYIKKVLSVSSISRTDWEATVTTAVSHGYAVGDWVTIEGVSPTAYNGNWEITSVPSSTTFKFKITSNPGAASGSMCCVKTTCKGPYSWNEYLTTLTSDIAGTY